MLHLHLGWHDIISDSLLCAAVHLFRSTTYRAAFFNHALVEPRGGLLVAFRILRGNFPLNRLQNIRCVVRLFLKSIAHISMYINLIMSWQQKSPWNQSITIKLVQCKLNQVAKIIVCIVSKGWVDANEAAKVLCKWLKTLGKTSGSLLDLTLNQLKSCASK